MSLANPHRTHGPVLTFTAEERALNCRVDVDLLERTIYPHGELDIATVSVLLDAVAVVSRDQVRSLTFDLRDVTLIDSVVLGAIVGIGNELAAFGAVLRLCEVPPKVARIFRLGGLGALLQPEGG
jgi:anti-anti-sigma factor